MSSCGAMWLVLVAVSFLCGTISADDVCMDKAQLDQKVDTTLSQAISTLKGDVTLPSKNLQIHCDYKKDLVNFLFCFLPFLIFPVSMDVSGGTLKNINGLRRDSDSVLCGSDVINFGDNHWTSETFATLTQDQPWTVTFKNVKTRYLFFFNLEGELTYTFTPSIYVTINQNKDLCSTDAWGAYFGKNLHFTPTNTAGKLLASVFQNYLSMSNFMDTLELTELPELKSTLNDHFAKAFCANK